ncbi:MAG: hypothetical protein A4E20_01495 [Nitrospira sp. SG-bin2]|uniref:hypothetical protein n=1 Tax=Nitrospira cf. moscoviensis SBR1015 TaxID=96242 RepID=UPI000A0A6550|nr:hypothetical protein [Nitrospira cf. moscoviensis SBR1015]OQW34879.1 MAG: hypothetical protein A4E20_01495 [Nitrospira sp. SG-bin2]
MSRCTPTTLHRLRERLAKEFEEILNSGEIVMKSDGEPLVIDGKVIMKRPSPAMYNVIRQFLRDNGIDREPVDVPPGQPVVDSLPFAEEEPKEIEGLPQHLLAAADQDF